MTRRRTAANPRPDEPEIAPDERRGSASSAQPWAQEDSSPSGAVTVAFSLSWPQRRAQWKIAAEAAAAADLAEDLPAPRQEPRLPRLNDRNELTPGRVNVRVDWSWSPADASLEVSPTLLAWPPPRPRS